MEDLIEDNLGALTCTTTARLRALFNAGNHALLPLQSVVGANAAAAK